MKIAYFSPFNPLRSGISDFSEELLMELKEHLTIDIFVDDYIPSNPDIIKNFKIFNIERIHDEEFRKQYDYMIFHVGNCKEYHKKIVDTFMIYGGILELHDLSLFHYWYESTVGENDKKGFINIMKYCHGIEGEKVAIDITEDRMKENCEVFPQKFMLNRLLIEKAQAVIVHSDMAKQVVKGIRPDVKIINIQHHTLDIIEDYKMYKDECRDKLNIKKDEIIVSSFGIASAPKRIIQIAKAVKLYNKKNKEKIHFYIVGEIKENKIWKSIKRLKENISATGYVELSEFKTYMGASDIIINLRFPTQGESSGSLHRAFGMGKPVIVTNTGTFSEYPNGVVLKVSHDSNEVNDIYEAISKLVQDTKLREEYGRNAFEFARENCSLKNNAVKYRDFIFDLFNGNLQEKDNIENLTDNLFYLGLTDEEYIKSLCNKLDIGIRWE